MKPLPSGFVNFCQRPWGRAIRSRNPGVPGQKFRSHPQSNTGSGIQSRHTWAEAHAGIFQRLEWVILYDVKIYIVVTNEIHMNANVMANTGISRSFGQGLFSSLQRWISGFYGRQSGCAGLIAGFSLVELLVVMAILAILMTAAIPALVSQGAAGAVSQGGADIADMATLARQSAISRNTPTALVASPVTIASQTLWGITVLGMTTNNGWSQFEKWTVLPQGILATNTGNSSPALPSSLTNTSLTFRGTSVKPSSPYSYVFYPDGQMLVSAGAVPKLRVLNQAGSGKTNNWYELVFNTATGTYKISRP